MREKEDDKNDPKTHTRRHTHIRELSEHSGVQSPANFKGKASLSLSHGFQFEPGCNQLISFHPHLETEVVSSRGMDGGWGGGGLNVE